MLVGAFVSYDQNTASERHRQSTEPSTQPLHQGFLVSWVAIGGTSTARFGGIWQDFHLLGGISEIKSRVVESVETLDMINFRFLFFCLLSLVLITWNEDFACIFVHFSYSQAWHDKYIDQDTRNYDDSQMCYVLWRNYVRRHSKPCKEHICVLIFIQGPKKSGGLDQETAYIGVNRIHADSIAKGKPGLELATLEARSLFFSSNQGNYLQIKEMKDAV